VAAHVKLLIQAAVVLRVLDNVILIPLDTCFPWIALLIQRTPFMVEKERENHLHRASLIVYIQCRIHSYCLAT
jgi:hypothetical protein